MTTRRWQSSITTFYEHEETVTFQDDEWEEYEGRVVSGVTPGEAARLFAEGGGARITGKRRVGSDD